MHGIRENLLSATRVAGELIGEAAGRFFCRRPIGRFAFAVGVFLAVLLAYLPTARYELVSLDDYEYVYGNEHVLSGLSVGNALWAFRSCGYACNWHPLTWLSLQADASLLPERPSVQPAGEPNESLRPLGAVMHAHNAMLHAANAALLFLLVVVLLRRLETENAFSFHIAAIFALLWALHPLRTEVVCWTSERKELLSVFWMLATMFAYCGEARSPVRWSLSLVSFALALLAKPVAVSLPVVLFAWDWVMTGRRFGKSLLSAIPFLLLAAGASAMTLAAQGEPLAVGMQFSLCEKVVMSLSAPVIYLRQTVWPVGLSVFYESKPPVPWAELCLGAALFAGAFAVCAAWLGRRKSKVLSLLAFAVAWCLVSLVPMLGIVKVGDQPHSDRYTYWVGCGLVSVAAIAVARYLKGREKETVKVLAVLVAVLIVATWFRMSVWRNSFLLYADAVPKSWAEQPTCTLSRLLRQKGAEGELQAEAMLREALMQTHRHSGIRAEFAHLLATRTEPSAFHLEDEDPAFAEARYEATTVLEGEPAHPLANEALALVEMKEGKWENALKRLELAHPKSDDAGRIDHYAKICRKRLAEGKEGQDVQK